MTLLYFWFIAYTLLVLLLIFGIQRLRMPEKLDQTISLDDVTILVPFRNEAQNLLQFIACVKSQRYQPIQWIFINDHSSDNFIHAFNGLDSFPIRLVHLPENQIGKKKAIRFGMDKASTKYTVTMDADVTFDKQYVQALMSIPICDFAILPVVMIGTKWWHHFFSLEYLFTHILNKGLSGWFRPINASGANLMYNQIVFGDIDDISEHEHILSGDDIFALRSYREHGKTIELIETKELLVQTKIHDSFRKVLDQRLRWVSKSSEVHDNLAVGVGATLVLLHLLYFMFLMMSLSVSDFWMLLLLVGVKSLLDFSLIYVDEKRWTGERIFGLICFELFFPIYLLVLFISGIFNSPDWKGRN